MSRPFFTACQDCFLPPSAEAPARTSFAELCRQFLARPLDNLPPTQVYAEKFSYLRYYF